jgi:hypothetical protein
VGANLLLEEPLDNPRRELDEGQLPDRITEEVPVDHIDVPLVRRSLTRIGLEPPLEKRAESSAADPLRIPAIVITQIGPS